MYSDRRGNGQNSPRTKSSRQKTSWQNLRVQLRENLYRGLLYGIFVLGLLKIGEGGPICVTYFWGVPGCVTKCYRGEGVNIGQK